MTSAERALTVLQKYGADGLIVDAFDSGAVTATVGTVRPHAMIEELTSLPKDYTPEAMRKAAEQDRKVRLEGAGNVNKAAQASGVKRCLVESSDWRGDDWTGRRRQGVRVELSDCHVANRTEVVACERGTFTKDEEMGDCARARDRQIDGSSASTLGVHFDCRQKAVSDRE